MRACCSALILTVVFSLSSRFIKGQGGAKAPLDNGSISGRVNIGDKPASGTVVAAYGDNANRRAAAQATADNDGRYVLSALAAGLYNVTVQAPAFVGTGSALYGTGKTVALSANEAVDSVDFKLARGAVITGRVTDVDNKPVLEERINLQLLDESGKPDQKPGRLPYNYQTYQTDDRGIYRIYGLPAGRYKVSVGNDPKSGFVTTGTRAYYQQTFYPDTTDTAKASIVELSEGSEATNVDIVVGRRNQTYSAAGRIVDADTGEPVGGIQVVYGSAPKEQSSFGGYIVLPATQRGDFRLEGLEPGRYGVYVSSQFGSQNRYSDPVFFDVVDGDVNNLEIKAIRGLSVSGVVATDGITSKEAFAQLSALKISANVPTTISGVRTYASGSSQIGADGSFQINGLRPGKASIYLNNYSNPALRAFSITRIERDGVEQAQGIDINGAQPTTGLQVFLAYGTGTIRGIVKIEGGTLPPDARLSLRLTREGASSPQTGGVVDSRGRFTLTNLAAGTYEIVLQAYIPNLNPPKRQPQPLVQTVSITDGGETEVAFTLDLSAESP